MPVARADCETATSRVGSDEHRRLLADFFIGTHREYTPENIDWPVLSESELARLTGLPFWQEAVATEAVTSATVTAAAALEADPALRRAIALQGFEEQRHARLLQALTAQYRIPIEPAPPYVPRSLEHDFLFAGFGECFDSFFAFGLFDLARESGYFPPGLVRLFEPVMDEEVRHILFFVNWVAARRAQLPWWKRPAFRLRCAGIILEQLASRLKTARALSRGPRPSAAPPAGNFTLSAHQQLAAPVSLHGLLRRCLAENERRMSGYDARLRRPRLVPALARLLYRLLPARL